MEFLSAPWFLLAGGRILEVWNKIDRFDPEERANLRNIAARRPPERPCFLVSAETGEGIDRLWGIILRAGDPVTAP